eukprot:4731911-Pleurochrysis_carterae.AAC.2
MSFPAFPSKCVRAIQDIPYTSFPPMYAYEHTLDLRLPSRRCLVYCAPSRTISPVPLRLKLRLYPGCRPHQF